MNPQGIVFAVSFAVINLCHTATFGQFKDAVYPQSSVGVVPVLANNTGNYILETGGVSYQVNVSDDMNGVNAMLSWKSGTATGFTAIDATTIVLDPDVCLVKNGAGSVFAIVA